MNHVVTNQSLLAPLFNQLAALSSLRGVSGCERFELEDTILRAAGFAWDIGAEAAPLHAQIQAILDAKEQADAEARAAAEIAAANYVPQSVTPWQMRRALNQLGLRAMVEAAVAEGDQNVKDGWEFALEIRRDNPLLAAMAGSLGMEEADLDNLFRLAASFQ